MIQAKAWIKTDRPDLVFENTAVGRMKKEIWDADEAQLDAILAEYGVPAKGGCRCSGQVCRGNSTSSFAQ